MKAIDFPISSSRSHPDLHQYTHKELLRMQIIYKSVWWTMAIGKHTKGIGLWIEDVTRQTHMK